jgi:hypothetical protein
MNSIIKVKVFVADQKNSVRTIASGDDLAGPVLEWYKKYTRCIAMSFRLQILDVRFVENGEHLLISYDRLPECNMESELIDNILSGREEYDEGCFERDEEPLIVGLASYDVFGEYAGPY